MNPQTASLNYGCEAPVPNNCILFDFMQDFDHGFDKIETL
jgi:hypothetical protein